MKQIQPLNIVFCIDDNFAVHLATLIQSIVANSGSSTRFHFHVCSAALSEQNQYKLAQAAGEVNTVQFYQIDSGRFEHTPVSQFFANRMSVVTYFRVLVPELLRSVTGLALFMDADMIVNTDITDLFLVDLNGAIAGVVEDSSIIKTDYWQELGLAQNRYFNAGLMLIDLTAWRENGVTSAAMEMIDSGRAYKFNDQDILNWVLKDQIVLMDVGWNVQQASLDALNSPEEAKVIHYNGAEKPWQYACVHPFSQLYQHFKAQTLYADTPRSHFIDKHDSRIIDAIERSQITEAYIYGAGQKGRRIVCFLQSKYPRLTICGLIDRAPKMDKFNGIPVMTAIPALNGAHIVVASSAYAEEIVTQLKQKRVPADRIIAVVDE
jgi:lipopolysaccharide biosynthesis glycosyltransferase